MEEKKKKKSKQEFDELNAKYLRALADYQNLSKRMDQERERLVIEAKKHAAMSLISIKEDIDKAESFSTDPGLVLIKKKLYDALAQLGVTELDPLGKEYEPHTMECIQLEPGKQDNIVTAVHQKGYLLNTILLRAATVTVGTVKTEEPITN